MINKIVIFAVMLFWPGYYLAAASATFTVSKNLSFGTMVKTNSSGTATLGLTNNMTINNGLALAPSGTPYYSGLVVWTGTGLSHSNSVLSTKIMQNTVTLTNGTGQTVTVNNFKKTPNQNVSSSSPTKSFSIGGRLSVLNTSTPGNYVGSVDLRASNINTGNTTVTIPIIFTLWQALAITKLSALSFGVIEVLTGNSTVRINPSNNSRTVISGAGGVALSTGSPSASAGVFKIDGQPNATYTVQLPTSITVTGPGTAMTVNNFTSFSMTAGTSYLLNASGNDNLKVGADIKINTNQAPGTYNGTYTVTVNY